MSMQYQRVGEGFHFGWAAEIRSTLASETSTRYHFGGASRVDTLS